MSFKHQIICLKILVTLIMVTSVVVARPTTSSKKRRVAGDIITRQSTNKQRHVKASSDRWLNPCAGSVSVEAIFPDIVDESSSQMDYTDRLLTIADHVDLLIADIDTLKKQYVSRRIRLSIIFCLHQTMLHIRT